MMSYRDYEIIELYEYKTESLDRSLLSDELGESLWRNYKNVVDVGFLSPRAGGNWELMSRGFIGYITLAEKFSIALKPKIKLTNIFHMLEYAYRLKSFRFLDGIIECESINDFYEHLVKILALRILDRSRRGFYREYISESNRLPYIRGKLSIRSSIKRPWNVKLKCRYEDHTSDIPDNQILLWTLYKIVQSGRCTELSLPIIRRSIRSLQGFSTLVPCNSTSCKGRNYNRLNTDYLPLHSLCASFLDQKGPSHEMGNNLMLPFLVNMARLYELFVAEWLKRNLPSNIFLKYQENLTIGEDQNIKFNIDMVLYDATNTEVLCVLDTKYKGVSSPSNEDIAQVVTYSEAKNCSNAILVYPAELVIPLDETIGDNRIRNLTFSLDGDLELNGQRFLENLLYIISK